MFCSFHYTSLTPLWLIPKYFNLFDIIVNGIIFMISFSVFSLLVYGNAVYFCVLTFILLLCYFEFETKQDPMVPSQVQNPFCLPLETPTHTISCFGEDNFNLLDLP